MIQVANLRPVPVKLFKGTKVGIFTPRNKVMLVEDKDTVLPGGLPSFSSLPQIDMSPDLSKPQQTQLQCLLEEFADLFALDGLGRTSLVRHSIHTERPPIKQPMRRLPVCSREVFRQEISRMLDRGVIRCSTSPWSSQVVLVRKKDGHGGSASIFGH